MAATPCRIIGAATAKPSVVALANAHKIRTRSNQRPCERSEAKGASPEIIAFISLDMVTRRLILLTDP